MAITPSFHRFSIFNSFLLLLDLKLGCTILTLFNLFNKSAGVFGLLAIFQGGTLAQLTLYAYSLGTIFISLWGLRGISEESAPTVMLYAHMYLGDHLISSLWSFYFFQKLYYFTEHNGQPPSGLMALIEGIESKYDTKGDHEIHHTPLEGVARVEAAQQVWSGESGFSGTVLLLGWVIKIYFALLLYSYALHLRHGTYRSLPFSKPSYSHATTAENRSNYLPLRASITIDRSGDTNGIGGAAGSRTLEDDLPGWSDDELDAEEGVAGGSTQPAQGAGRSGAGGAKAALDRLASRP